MGWFSDDSEEAQAHEQVYGEEKHKGALSHEVIGGAAAFEAMKAFERHQEKNGKIEKHQLAKEVIAGLLGGELDKIIETKGLDEVDALKAKHHARERTNYAIDKRFQSSSFQSQ